MNGVQGQDNSPQGCRCESQTVFILLLLYLGWVAALFGEPGKGREGFCWVEILPLSISYINTFDVRLWQIKE